MLANRSNQHNEYNEYNNDKLMPVWRLEYKKHGVNLGNLCLCLPVRTCLLLWEGNYTEVVCRIVCYMAVKLGQWGKRMSWHFSAIRWEWLGGCVVSVRVTDRFHLACTEQKWSCFETQEHHLLDFLEKMWPENHFKNQFDHCLCYWCCFYFMSVLNFVLPTVVFGMSVISRMCFITLVAGCFKSREILLLYYRLYWNHWFYRAWR